MKAWVFNEVALSILVARILMIAWGGEGVAQSRDLVAGQGRHAGLVQVTCSPLLASVGSHAEFRGHLISTIISVDYTQHENEVTSQE
jgi:hypothetical protein